MVVLELTSMHDPLASSLLSLVFLLARLYACMEAGLAEGIDFSPNQITLKITPNVSSQTLCLCVTSVGEL